MPAGTQTRRILIKVDTQDSQKLREIADRMGLLNRNTKSLAGNVKFLTSAFTGYISALGLRELARLSDEMQNLSNRLKIVSRDTEDNTKIMADLLRLADETNQSVGNVGEVYARLGSSLKAANTSSSTLLGITKALINTFRVSGATTTETVNTLIQLSQAFASGQLRGQELRSVLEQNAELARILRERYGANIFKEAEKGAITAAEVLRLLFENQERVNESAKQLTPTFEQTLAKAVNRVQFALHNLNTELGLASKFARGLDIVTERMSLLLTVVGALALTQIPALIKSIQALSLASLAIVRNNPLAAVLVATAAIVVATNKSLDEFIDKIRNLGAWLVYAKVQVLEFNFALEKGIAKGLNSVGLLSQRDIVDLARQLDEINRLKKLAEDLGTPTAQQGAAPGASLDAAKKEQEELLKYLDSIGTSGQKTAKVKDILAELNKELTSGAITIGQYNDKLVDFELYKLNREFKEGKFDVFTYNERLKNLKIEDFNRQLEEGVIDLRQYNDAIQNLQITELNAKFEAGKIGLIEYNQELVKVSQKFEPGSALIAGTSSYIQSIGTLSENVANGIRQTFSHLEDNLVEFIKKGKFNFRDFTQAILDDLTRIIIRASIVQPLAQGILSGFTGGGATTLPASNISGVPAAKGMGFDNGVRKFASGGIVNSPTMFRYGGNKTGVMGEAGSEAILPLRRGRGGDLGVAASVTPVTVNIINQTDSETTQTETTGPGGEKIIDILITSKVKDGIVSGKYDSAFKTAYGINRRGS